MSSLYSVGSNDRARKIAQALGFKDAESLKGDYVKPGDIRRCDICYDKDTKELLIVSHDGFAKQPTGLFMPVSFL